MPLSQSMEELVAEAGAVNKQIADLVQAHAAGFMTAEDLAAAAKAASELQDSVTALHASLPAPKPPAAA